MSSVNYLLNAFDKRVGCIRVCFENRMHECSERVGANHDARSCIILFEFREKDRKIGSVLFRRRTDGGWPIFRVSPKRFKVPRPVDLPHGLPQRGRARRPARSRRGPLAGGLRRGPPPATAGKRNSGEQGYQTPCRSKRV